MRWCWAGCTMTWVAVIFVLSVVPGAMTGSPPALTGLVPFVGGVEVALTIP